MSASFGSGTALTLPKRAKWLLHEPLFAVLLLLVGLEVRRRGFIGGSGLANEILAVAVIWTGLIWWLARDRGVWGERLRILATYLLVLWIYVGIKRFVPALGLQIWDSALRRADEGLFQSMPATWIPQDAAAWLTDVMSVGYVAFHVYLHWAFGEAGWCAGNYGQRFIRRVGSAYLLGFVGYLLVPAMGPLRAFPELVQPHIGNAVSRAISAFVASGSSVYDVFPSLHVLVTFAILDFDWRCNRRRFCCMLIPAIGIVGSTVYLGYHYAVDLLAAVAVVAVCVGSGWWRDDCELEPEQVG